MLRKNKKELRAWGRQLDAGSGQDELHQLAAELEERPFSAPNAPTPFKQGLRRDLIDRHPTQKTPFWQQLRAALGTAVAVGVLALAVFVVWTAVSTPPEQPAPAAVSQPHPTATATPLPALTAVPPHPLDAAFGNEAALAGYDLMTPPYLPGMTVTGALYWRQPAAEPLMVFVHLIPPDGPPVAQVDHALDRAITDFALPLPPDLPPGEYDLVAGVYDANTGQRLETTVTQTAVTLTAVTVEPLPVETEDSIEITAVSPPGGSFLTGPTPITVSVAYDLVSLANAELAVELIARIDETQMRGIATASTTINQGAGEAELTIPFAAADLNEPASLLLLAEIVPPGEQRAIVATAPEQYQMRYDPAAAGQDSVALLSATQKERETAMMVFEVSLAVNVVSTETAVLKLQLAHPEWEQNGQVAGDLAFQPVAGNTYRLTAAPDQIRAATGSDHPVLLATLGPPGEGEGDAGRTENGVMLRQTFTACPLDLTRSDEIVCAP